MSINLPKRVTLRTKNENDTSKKSSLPVRQPNRFCSRCAFVEQGRVGHREPREVSHHRLVVQEGFEATLGHFRLVWRVLRCPAGAWNFLESLS